MIHAEMPRKKPAPPKMGRPTLYEKAACEKVKKFLRLRADARNVDIAEHLQISEKTYDNWMKKHPDFIRAVWDGKHGSDANVANALYYRAIGYKHDDVHIVATKHGVEVIPIVKHYPPDTAAGKLWLLNRQRKTWTERSQVEHMGEGGGPVQVEDLTEGDELAQARRIAFALAAAAKKKKAK